MTDSRSLRQKVLSGLAWSALQGAGVKLSGLLLFMLITRLVAPEELGLFSAAATVMGFITLFIDQGLSEAVVQRQQITAQQVNSVFLINLGISIVLVLLLWLVAPHIASHFKLPGLTDVLRVSSLGILIGAICFSQWAMQRRNFQYRWLAITAIASSLGAGLLALGMANQGMGVWALVAQGVAGTTITAVLLWSVPQWRFSFEFDFQGVGAMVRYGLNRLGANLLDYANTRYIDFFIVGMLGPAALGLYSVGVRIQQALMQTLSAAILDVAHNSFSRMAHDRPALIEAYYKAVTVTAAVAVPPFVLSAALAPEAIQVLFGRPYAESAAVLGPLSLLGAVQVVQFYNGTIFNALGRPSIGLAFLVLKTILTLLALWAAQDRDLAGLVMAYVFAQLATTPASFYLVQRLVGISMVRTFQHVWRFVAINAAVWWLIAYLRPVLEQHNLSVMVQGLALGLVAVAAYAAGMTLFARHQVAGIVALLRKRQIS